MAQWAERLLPTPEIRSSNPNIGNKNILNVIICQLLSGKDENRAKEAGKAKKNKKDQLHQTHNLIDSRHLRQ